MHYPWWYVPGMTAPMIIALVSVFHVFIAMYAVGGGLFLAVETSYAYRTENRAYLSYLYKHTRFFIFVTLVFGAISGVGIWWTIGLASPLATETLIRIFVFAWASEWVFFVIELTTAFLFYYFWGRLAPGTHQTLGWIYAVSAWMSLFIITGITAFMLQPGAWLQTGDFIDAFFNPQTIPQTLSRTGGSLLLASLYVFLHASFTLKEDPLIDLLGRRSSRPALMGAILILLGGVTWYSALPPSARAALASASALNIFMTLLFAVTVAVFFMLYLGPYRNPRWVTPGFALLFLSFGILAVSTGEFIREAVRKPYIIYNLVTGHQLYVDEIPGVAERGFLESGLWTRLWLKENYPQVFEGRQVDESRLIRLPLEDRKRIGKVLFMYHCNDCHALKRGYSASINLMRGWNRELILDTLLNLHKAEFFMPPWTGTKEEAEILADFLLSIRPPPPEGMHFGNERP